MFIIKHDIIKFKIKKSSIILRLFKKKIWITVSKEDLDLEL